MRNNVDIQSQYQGAVDYIEELPRFTKKHKLEHTKEFLHRLGNPADDRKVIHVAGTNGKGSVCAYIQAILMAEGKRCGFFTSPHLVCINERIRIDNVQIEDDAFLMVFKKVYKVACEMEEEGLGHPSYFEFLYGMGMSAFAVSDVEYIILETGLGGRLDATNALDQPALTVITSISLDHTDILGDTIEQIAAEKAGIIKKGVPVIFDSSNEKASLVIRECAKKREAPCREITNYAYEIQEVTRKSIAFCRGNAYDEGVMWTIPLCGIYQAMNAVIALTVAEYLLQQETIHIALWQKALGTVCWEGRMEEVIPHLTIDGAHNPGAVEAFVQSVHAIYGQGMVPPVVIFSAMSDKKYDQMIAYLCENMDASVYIVTEVEDSRKVSTELLAETFKKYTKKKVIRKSNIVEAVEVAFQYRGEGEIYCLGSLYLTGSIKKLLTGGSNHA